MNAAIGAANRVQPTIKTTPIPPNKRLKSENSRRMWPSSFNATNSAENRAMTGAITAAGSERSVLAAISADNCP